MKSLLRWAFEQLPFKRLYFRFFRAAFRPSERIYRHLHFLGDFGVRVDDSHSFRMRHYGFQLENEIFWAGLDSGWEKISLSLWQKLVVDAEVIIDVGANTGVYCLIAKSLNPSARVIAFEPVDRVFAKLETNVAINRFDVTCEKLALSNSDGTATIYDTPTDHIYSVTVNKNLNSADATVIPTEIRIVRLDTYIEGSALDKVDLIKIDVETHEPEVLQGLGDYLGIFQPTMLVEVLNDEVGAAVEELVGGLGYLYFNIDEAKGSVRHVDKIEKSDYYNYLICQPNVAKKLGLDFISTS